jgi:enoyl-CoA hydratase/carnithine racemase
MDHVTVTVEHAVATIFIDRPPINALNSQVQAALGRAVEEVTDRHDVRAVVVTGGPKRFAGGADIKEMAGWTYPDAVDRSRALQASFNAVAALPKPVIAAIGGYALGGGLELALAADFRVCGDNARLGQPEILLGLIPGAGGTQRLPRLIGPARAKDLVFTGRTVEAAEALAIGLVDDVVAPDDVVATAQAWAARLAAGPAYAMRAAKEAIDAGLSVDLATGLEIERQQFAALFATADREIGMTSFIQSGPGQAEFRGA